MDAPGGVALSGDRVFVADFYNHRVQAFVGAGCMHAAVGEEDCGIQIFGTPGRIRGGRMNYPTDVAASDSLVYVADAYNHRVQVFRPDGSYVGRWGGPLGTGLPGSFKGWFRVATGIHVSSDTVYVADFYNHRIQVFDGGGRYLGRIDGALNLPTAVTRGGRGELYVADFGNGRVLRFDPRGR